MDGKVNDLFVEVANELYRAERHAGKRNRRSGARRSYPAYRVRVVRGAAIHIP